MFGRKKKEIHECPLAFEVRKKTQTNRKAKAFKYFTEMTEMADEWLYKASKENDETNNSLTINNNECTELEAYEIFPLLKTYYAKKGYITKCEWIEDDGYLPSYAKVTMIWENITIREEDVC